MLSERPVGIILLNAIDHPRGSVTSRKSGTNNDSKRRTRHLRLHIQNALYPQRPSNASKTGGSWNFGHQAWVKCSKASGNSMTFYSSKQRSSPQNQSHNWMDSSIKGNHILKDTGRTERKWRRLKWMSLGNFFFFLISKCLLFPLLNFLLLFCFILTNNVKDLVISQKIMQILC